MSVSRKTLCALLPALVATAIAISCAKRPVELYDPTVDLSVAGDRPIDAFTTPSVSAMRFSYMELPGMPQEGATTATLADLAQLDAREISLSEAIQFVLNNNLDIKIVSIDREIAADRIEEEKGVFDIIVAAGAGYSRDKRQTATSRIDPITGEPMNQDDIDLPEVKRAGDQYRIGVARPLESGGQVSVVTTNGRDYTYDDNTFTPNPANAQEHLFRFDQPLLRNAGFAVNYARIRIARNDKRVAFENWRREVMAQVADVARVYWDLVFAVNRARVTRLSLLQAESLLENNRAKVEVGLASPIDVLQAEAQMAAREEQLIRDLQAINEVQDDLKRRMRLAPGHELWNFALIPIDPPIVQKTNLDVEACLNDAYAKRPEIASIHEQADTLAETELVNRNAKLPQLDVFAEYGASGLDHRRRDAFDEANHFSHKNWAAGVEFSYPLQNRQARYRLRQTRKRIEQIKLQHESLIDNIALQVRSAIRAIRTNEERIKSARAQSEYEAAKLDKEIKRFENGMSTSQDVLDFQEDLALARSTYISALVDFNKSLIDLDQARGIILEKLGVAETYDEPDKTWVEDLLGE